MKKLIVFILILLSTLAYSLDLDSYCKGFCVNRYMDGIERNGQCFCGDYYPINSENRIGQFHRPKKPVFGYVYE